MQWGEDNVGMVNKDYASSIELLRNKLFSQCPCGQKFTKCIRMYIINSIMHLALSQTGLAGCCAPFYFLVMLHLQRQCPRRLRARNRKWVFHARCPSIKHMDWEIEHFTQKKDPLCRALIKLRPSRERTCLCEGIQVSHLQVWPLNQVFPT